MSHTNETENYQWESETFLAEVRRRVEEINKNVNIKSTPDELEAFGLPFSLEGSGLPFPAASELAVLFNWVLLTGSLWDKLAQSYETEARNAETRGDVAAAAEARGKKKEAQEEAKKAARLPYEESDASLEGAQEAKDKLVWEHRRIGVTYPIFPYNSVQLLLDPMWQGIFKGTVPSQREALHYIFTNVNDRIILALLAIRGRHDGKSGEDMREELLKIIAWAKDLTIRAWYPFFAKVGKALAPGGEAYDQLRQALDEAAPKASEERRAKLGQGRVYDIQSLEGQEGLENARAVALARTRRLNEAQLGGKSRRKRRRTYHKANRRKSRKSRKSRRRRKSRKQFSKLN
jgi:hypothetical protein